MDSSVRENYSIPPWFYLFCFLLFLTGSTIAQEVLWSNPGIGARPELNFLGEESKVPLAFVSSPFSTQVRAIKAGTGDTAWTRKFPERFSYTALALSDYAIVQGDQGTIWALFNDTGEIFWASINDNPQDFPMAPLRFRQESIYALGRKGFLKKIDPTGRVLAQGKLDDSWGERKATTIPLRSNLDHIVYLDQSGRLTSVEPETMKLDSLSLWNNAPKAQRVNGQTHEVVGGAMVAGKDILCTVELPGFLRCTRLADNQGLWSRSLFNPSDLWSQEGKLLAIPTALDRNGVLDIWVVTVKHSIFVSLANGEVLEQVALPSPAAAPPTYDPDSKTWWLLCEQHLIRVDAERNQTIFELPIVDRAYSLKVKRNMIIVATVEGRVYGLKWPG